MSGSRKDFRQGRAPSLLAVEPADDAVLRHARARSRRERRPSPLLSAPMPPAAPQADTEIDKEPGAAPSRPRLRDLVFGRPPPADDAAAERPEPEALARDSASHPDPVSLDTSEPPAAPRRASGAYRPVVGLTLAGAVLGAAVALAWPKTYVATSEMLIDPHAAQSGAASLSSDAAFALVDNQLRVLRSGTMLNAAAERLNLAADAEFNGAASGPLGLGGVLSGLGDLVAGDGAGAMERRRRHVVEALDRAVQASRVGGSSVIAVSARTADPMKSALIANTISELFVASAGNAPGSAGEMTARLAELRDGVEEAERAIEAFKAQNGLVDAQGRLITDDEILRLGERLSAAQARTVELNARAASTRDANVDSIVTGSLPEQYASPTLTGLRARYADAKQQVDRLSVKLGPRHPELLAAQAELEGSRQEIGGELRRVASALQTELTRAVRQEQELASQLAEMKTRQGDIGGELVALRELEREAEAKRSVYEQSLRAAQTGGQASATGGASLISRAEPPLHAAGPSLPAFSLAGALGGLLAGLGLAGWRRLPKYGAEDGPEALTRADEAAPTDETAPMRRDMEADERRAGRESAPEAKEAEDMHRYSPYAYPYAPAAPAHPQPAQPAAGYAPPAPAHAAYPPHPEQGHPVYAQPAPVPPAPMGWQPPQHPAAWQPQPPAMPAPGWPAAPYPAPPQFYAPPAAYAPPPPYYGAPAYAPPPQPAAYAPPAAPVREAPPPHRPADERFDQDAYIDESTDAAIQEIRQSLREFRDAIEDFADSRAAPRRRYGT